MRFAPRTIAGKLRVITAMALILAVAMGGVFIAAFTVVEESAQKMKLLHDEAERGDELFRAVVSISDQLDEAMVDRRTDGISEILAQNETFVGAFSAYKKTAEEHNMASFLVFARENEELILNMRRDVYDALTLHRDGRFAEAEESKQRIARNAYHLSTAIERTNAQQQSEFARYEEAMQHLRHVQMGMMFSIFGLGAIALIASSIGFSRSILRNLIKLSGLARQLSSGNYDHHVEIDSRDEFEELARAFNEMSRSLKLREEQILEQQRTIEKQRAAELARTVVQLDQSNLVRDRLNQTVRELSSPVLPVMEGILVLPLIGIIDEERAELFMRSILAALDQHQATMIIVDVTGVPTIDEGAARALLTARATVRLLGAEMILVGMRSEVARTVVALGTDLSDLVTLTHLQSGLKYAIKQHARRAPSARVLGDEQN